MSDGRHGASAIRTAIKRAIESVQPFKAVSTGLSGSLATIRLPEAAAGDDEEYARLAGRRIAVGDDVIVLPVNGTPFVLGKAVREQPLPPTITLGAASGTGGSPSGVAVGTDENFRVVLTTGNAGLAAGVLFIVTFQSAWPDTEFIVDFSAADGDAAAAATKVFWDQVANTTTTFEFETNAALSANTSYRWGFRVGWRV